MRRVEGRTHKNGGKHTRWKAGKTPKEFMGENEKKQIKEGSCSSGNNHSACKRICRGIICSGT